MKTIYWTTDEPHWDNSETMSDYLENINMLDISFVDGTYAEGSNDRGEHFAIHASGNGDFYTHKIEFELLLSEDKP